jgi:hypothetical protein
MRMADEVDASQERGEIREPGRHSNSPKLGELDIDSRRLSEWRDIRDAGEDVVEDAIQNALNEPPPDKMISMTKLEQARSKCLRARRRCQRGLKHAKATNLRGLAPEQRDRLHRNIGYLETAIALTPPAFIRKASSDELISVLRHLTKTSN